MPEWLTHPFHNDATVSIEDAIVRLLTTVVFGAVVAAIYRWTRGRSSDRRFTATLVLLTLLMSVTTVVIGDNVARAFSIVGALSIVRFRTVVEDTRDTAFVICSVTIGLAVGAGYSLIPALALVFVAAAAKYFSGEPRGRIDGEPGAFSLKVKVATGFSRRDELQRGIAEATVRPNLIGIESARAGAAIERCYEVELSGDSAVDGLVDRLSAIEGVLAVEVVRLRK